MTNDVHPDNSRQQADAVISQDDARRIGLDAFVSSLVRGVRVELAVGSFYGAPPHPVWLVWPLMGERVGGDHLIAICPTTGRVLFNGMVGE